MKKILLSISITLVFAGLAFAESSPNKLLIIEVSTGNSQSASAEFIEIYNPHNSVIDLADYKLEYKSAEGTDWSTKANLEGKIAIRGRLLFATSSLNISGSKTIASGLATTGGHIRISKNNVALDVLGWGTADSPELQAAEVHDDEQSVKRQVDEDGYFIDTDNNFEDFFFSDEPTPSFDTYVAPITTPVKETGNKTPVSGTTNNPAVNSTPVALLKKTYPVVKLSEILVDPKTPQTDKEDEFIELYNPNEAAVDLTGYQIQSGSTSWRYKYQFESGVIKSKSWLAITSADSGLTLSNSGAKVQLLDPNGAVLDGLSYEKAKAGQSLVNLDGKWQWSDSPTPGAVNSKAVTSQDGSTSDDENFSASSNFEHVASATSEKDKSDNSKSGQSSNQPQESTIDTSVLVIAGGLALLYGLYEYRQDIRGAITKLGRYLKSWRKTRTAN